MRSYRHHLEGIGQKANRLFLQGMSWRVRHIPDRHFVLILSGLVGVAAGLGAVVLKSGVHLVQRVLKVSYPLPAGQWQYLGYPLAGLVLTVLIRRYLFGEKPGQGVSDILYAIARKSSQMPRSHMFSRVLTSICTVGFGGSAGLEAPSMVTGAAAGANLGQAMHLKTSRRTLLMGCGAAGALAAIFNAPIAGVVFSVELILAEASIQTFIPLLIASASATLVSQVLAGDDVLFAFRITDTFRTRDLPYYLALGLFTGMLSLAFVKVVNFVEGSIERIGNALGRAVVGGALLGLLIFFLPGVYGEGYALITALLDGNTNVIQLRVPGVATGTGPASFLLAVGLLLVTKMVATGLTLGGGGRGGGIFGPSLVTGGLAGFFFARLVNGAAISPPVAETDFILVGMCGLLSGVQYAPMTAIFMIAEVTGGYLLFIPLMIVSALSYTTVTLIEPHSIYTKRLFRQGDLPPNDKDRQLLNQINISKLVEKDVSTVSPQATLGQLIEMVKTSHRNIFPVVNNRQQLVGLITLDDIRTLMFEVHKYDEIKVSDLMHAPPARVSPLESMYGVMEKFEKTGAWNLPVTEDGIYIGLLSKSTIFNAYRKKLILLQKE